MPDFLVKESKFVDRIKSRWRFPMGRHSKVRQFHCGRPAMPTPGYGSPREVRGLHSSGLRPVAVATVDELKSLDSASEGAVIVSTVGNKKRLDLLQFALANKIRVINVKDSQKLIEKIHQNLDERQKLKKEKSEIKSKKQLEKERKAEEKKKKDADKKEQKAPASDQKEEDLPQEKAAVMEEEKKKEQREMEKIITQR